MTITFLKIENVKEMNPVLLPATHMVPEALFLQLRQ